MMIRLKHWTLRAAFVASVVLLGAVSSAAALDAYWQGRRSGVWEHGVSGGVSNWYSQPPLAGVARDVPDGGAVFAPGTTRTSVQIVKPTNINTILILRNAPRFNFIVRKLPSRAHSWLVFKGAGLINQSLTPPVFTIGKGANMWFINASRMTSSQAVPDAQIRIERGGEMAFQHSSKGGDARVSNRGYLLFNGNTTAERMVISILPPKPPDLSGGDVLFMGRSNGGHAYFYNYRQGRLSFMTRGPAGDKRVSAGLLSNNGTIQLGTNLVSIQESFTQFENGTLKLNVENNVAGGLRVKGKARLNGYLFVDGYTAAPGAYLIVRAEGGREGAFQSLITSVGGASLRYFPNEVYLIIQ